MECPKCHFENKPGAKFCVKCGTKLDSKGTSNFSNDYAKAKNDTKEISVAANDFFKIFLESIKHPMKAKLPENSKSGFGFLLIYLVLSWLTCVVIGNKIINTIGQFSGGLMSKNNPVADGISHAASQFGIYIVISLLGTWILGWIGIRLMLNNRMSLENYTMNFSRFLNAGSLIFLISMLLIFICPVNIIYIGLFFFVLGLVMSTFAITNIILTTTNNSNVDSLYVLMIVYMIMAIVGYFVLQGIVGNLMTDMFSNITGSHPSSSLFN